MCDQTLKNIDQIIQEIGNDTDQRCIRRRQQRQGCDITEGDHDNA